MGKTNKQTPQPELPKIKIFQIIQKNLTLLGIDPNSTMKSYLFNPKNLIGFSSVGLTAICAIMYAIKVASTFNEYTKSFCVFSTTTLSVLNLMVMLFFSSELFEAINDCECIVNTSKYKINLNLRCIILQLNRSKKY